MTTYYESLEALPYYSLEVLMYTCHYGCPWASLGVQRLKRLPAMWETRVRSLGREYPLEKEMATYSNILAWEIPWTEGSSGLQSIWVTKRQTQLSG